MRANLVGDMTPPPYRPLRVRYYETGGQAVVVTAKFQPNVMPGDPPGWWLIARGEAMHSIPARAGDEWEPATAER